MRAFLAVLVASSLGFAPSACASLGPDLTERLDRSATAVDLTWPLNARTPHWPAPAYKPFEIRTIATLEKDGVFSQAFCMPEHHGTHLDAPNHFERGQAAVDAIPIGALYGEAVVLDIAERAARDADAMLEVEDVAAFEARFGTVPKGTVVLLRTGWSRRASDFAAYKNQDEKGALHFPGYSPAAALLLVKRGVKGIGIDTLSIDRGLSTGFEVHHAVNAAGVYGLENLSDGLEKLPPRGAFVIALPIKIEGGSGGPARVVAFVPK